MFCLSNGEIGNVFEQSKNHFIDRLIIPDCVGDAAPRSVIGHFYTGSGLLMAKIKVL
ncbi:hypothetical protein BN439_2166 [Erwinia amylovora Ea644]|uniref:Uncharacterized protein n=3 Tax=Erwinia amylovora TaxID=552 RepID=A0A831EQQ8_ERWAM|nr:hypothetical protein EaACW_1782 [Erwinia amylovora ACW56400]QJQ54513.1 hypothetical protein EHX00_1809 [Erwinia amylovora]CBA20725.1 hypothetical protein predicted by Glimmer/Critica [Erwinia amylovora CFBP1430]CBJ46414.1 hypothetical protein EAM_1739 [Erwinia amylovora ATCC 49946]CBX80646.1 hypothetical protein predicted by Glimmer/Critica [Erwinia amylovora ATCC BAA-2158]CCO78630.1 hypothetical protein BN432_1832 [Erwinia amylovora Ea356]CCO82424.1 hypothetical protein BN433_1854 [Erwini